MQIALLNVAESQGHVTGYAYAKAPDAGAKIWVEVVFERSAREPRAEARDRVLMLLDIS